MKQERKEYLYNYQREKLKRVPLDVQKEFYEEMKAAADAVGQKVNAYIKQAIRERMERETAGRSDAQSAAAQRPTEAVTASPDETTPPQAGTPSETAGEVRGVVMGNAASDSGEGEQVTPSPTLRIEKERPESSFLAIAREARAKRQAELGLSDAEYEALVKKEEAERKERQRRERAEDEQRAAEMGIPYHDYIVRKMRGELDAENSGESERANTTE